MPEASITVSRLEVHGNWLEGQVSEPGLRCYDRIHKANILFSYYDYWQVVSTSLATGMNSMPASGIVFHLVNRSCLMWHCGVSKNRLTRPDDVARYVSVETSRFLLINISRRFAVSPLDSEVLRSVDPARSDLSTDTVPAK